jgi:hypothetical protein
LQSLFFPLEEALPSTVFKRALAMAIQVWSIHK